jgi:hypothetical protein
VSEISVKDPFSPLIPPPSFDHLPLILGGGVSGPSVSVGKTLENLTASTTTNLLVSLFDIVTLLCAFRKYVPKEYQVGSSSFAKFFCWLTMTRLVPSWCCIVTGTLGALEDHQKQ